MQIYLFNCRNSYCGIIEFSNASITVSGPGYNAEIPIDETQRSTLIFQAKETKKFYFNFRAPYQNDGVEIRISTVSLQMGDCAHCCIIMRFSAMGRETNLLDRLYPEIQQLRYVYKALVCF